MFSKEGGKVKALDGVFLSHPVHIFLHTGAVICVLLWFSAISFPRSYVRVVLENCHYPRKMVDITYRVFSLMFRVIY